MSVKYLTDHIVYTSDAKLARFVKKHQLDDKSLYLLFMLSRKGEDEFSRYGRLYYQQYGFSSELEEKMLSENEDGCFDKFIKMFLSEFQFFVITVYKCPNGFTIQRLEDGTPEWCLELLKTHDEILIGFFRGVRKLAALLSELERAQADYERECRSCDDVQLSGSYILEDAPTGLACNYGTSPSYVHWRRRLGAYYPSVALQEQILESGNPLWIETMFFVIIRVRQIWKKVFNIEFEHFSLKVSEYIRLNNISVD